MHHICRYFHLLLALVSLGFIVSSNAQTLETYANFNTGGVIVRNASTFTTARLQYRRSGESSYLEGHSLSSVVNLGNINLAGSLFWLSPDTAYDVRVILPNNQVLPGRLTTRSESEIVPPSPTRILHVSPTGAGTCNSVGSSCTLTTAISQVNRTGSGVVEIRLQGGTYSVGDLWLDSPATVVILRAASGQTPILDGSEAITGGWSGPSNGVYRRNLPGPMDRNSLVLADGQRLYPYASLSDLQNLRWGLSGFYTDGSQLHVRLTSGANPATRTMRYSTYSEGLGVNQNNVFIIGLTFRYYGEDARARAVTIRSGTTNTVVRDNHFISNDSSIDIRLNANRVVIQGNTFTDTVYPQNDPDSLIWDAIKNDDSPIREWENGGIKLASASSGSDPTPRPRGTVIRHNTFSGYFDGVAPCPYFMGTDSVTNETDLHHNTFYNMADDAVSFDGYCSNVRAWSNVFHDVLVGISMAPVPNGPVYAVGNLIRDLKPRIIQGSPGTGSSFKFIVSDPTLSGEMHIYHNTVDARYPCDDGVWYCASGFVVTSGSHLPNWSRLSTRNNIFVTGTDGQSLRHHNVSTTNRPVDLDCDVLWNDDPDYLVAWSSGPSYYSLAQFRSLTGLQSRGRNTNPALVGHARTLPVNSPLRDSACTITGINNLWPGELPDFGYGELLPPLFRDGFE